MNLWKYQLAKMLSSMQPNHNQVGRRVLMYHSINPTNGKIRNIYTISKEKFTQHVDLLSSHHKNRTSLVVPLTNPEPTGVSITFDDGYSDTLTVAAKLLCSENLPFSVFVTAQNTIHGNSNYLNKTQLTELCQMPNVTIGSHGFSHLHLADLPSDLIKNELRQSKQLLEDLIGKPVDTMSYPHGSYNAEVLAIAAEVGYKYAATSKWGAYSLGSNPLEIPRIDVWSYDNDKTLDQKLNGKWDWIKRFV
jgi:peptidoglycan/xylan/chitin deacetylase (PgdA/CDA1 family)